MLSEISPATSGRRRIEIFHNERYSPISGWSSDSLLLTDRGKYSTGDGSVSFPSLEEASKAFISIGWVWDGDWERDISLQNVDESGFSYATDFIGFDGETSGSAVKGMMHFVRRKRMIRFQYFEATMIANDPKFTCDNCDLEELDRLEVLLRDVLVEATLRRHPRYLSQPKINAIKDVLVGLLKLRDDIGLKAPYSTEAISSLLSELGKGRTNLAMASASVLHVTSNVIEYQATRAMEVLKYFPTFERTELSKLIIRKYDKEYNYHCNVRNCGSSCIFRIETCPNANCGVIYSKKWDLKHDAICPEKILDCERFCGEKIIRKQMASHLLETCTLRPITCPFATIGCETVCAFRHLDDHLHDYMQVHLSLSLKRIDEQQAIIINMNRRLQFVESHTEDLEKHYQATSSAFAASLLAVETAEKRSAKSLKDEIDKVDSKLQRMNHDLGNELRAEIGKIRRQIKI